ncbi:MAG: hypothetical protein Q8858_15535, partial [Bacteroidota bacterium]|nr:hypothetical protein [Bacteroidota bacterium]
MYSDEYPNLTPDKLNDDVLFNHAKTYYEDGKLRSERYYTDGLLLLKEIFYSPSGQVREIINYKKDGSYTSRQRFSDEVYKSGLALTYYEDGQVQSQRYYVDGKIHWEEKIFSPKGQLLEVITYYKGGKNGKHTVYNENGAKVFEIDYKNNLPDGTSKFYYENG